MAIIGNINPTFSGSNPYFMASWDFGKIPHEIPNEIHGRFDENRWIFSTTAMAPPIARRHLRATLHGAKVAKCWDELFQLFRWIYGEYMVNIWWIYGEYMVMNFSNFAWDFTDFFCLVGPGWWFEPRPLKNMSSSVGMMKFPIWWKKNNVPNHQPEVTIPHARNRALHISFWCPLWLQARTRFLFRWPNPADAICIETLRSELFFAIFKRESKGAQIF